MMDKIQVKFKGKMYSLTELAGLYSLDTDNLSVIGVSSDTDIILTVYEALKHSPITKTNTEAYKKSKDDILVAYSKNLGLAECCSYGDYDTCVNNDNKVICKSCNTTLDVGLLLKIQDIHNGPILSLDNNLRKAMNAYGVDIDILRIADIVDLYNTYQVYNGNAAEAQRDAKVLFNALSNVDELQL